MLKAHHDDTVVDLICPAGGPVTDEMLDRAEEREVMAMRLPVASLEDVLVTKLLALTEQEPNYGAVLEIARTLRERSAGTRGASERATRRSRSVLHADRGARNPARARAASRVGSLTLSEQCLALLTNGAWHR